MSEELDLSVIINDIKKVVTRIEYYKEELIDEEKDYYQMPNFEKNTCV